MIHFKPDTEAITILILIAVVLAAIWLLAIINLLKSEFTEPTNKVVWIITILTLGPAGAILYFTIGDNQKSQKYFEAIQQTEKTKKEKWKI